ncbi:putative selenate ABC transporter substrate-binding protein [Caldalkalibacillus thermarum]|uniref:phosphate/phosphite/phosphonate ABC transporter substrate-binding protein n=1 Tax=Caldalkalibacillus thermarum TaxID=296745 RepID=UPI001664408D|nr:phosphate/phosphite/phosphonate ABC transporter substrate-binding protein [Caldalkalibacillus thermarum]GGK11847.1 putative selenate ABC transporter substrate-binding protein [Caldalkalibacillus thermarum]
MKKLGIIFCAVVMILAACGTTADETAPDQESGTVGDETAVEQQFDVFKIGVIPALTEGDYEVPMQKLEAILDEALPYDVEIEVYPDYNAVVEALNFHHIQMAYLGPATYVIANERSGAQAIVTQLIDGKPYYHSYIITHADAPWDSLDELVADAENVSFAFGDINSTSGSLVPGAELKRRGVFEDENNHQFKDVRYLGSHDATGLAVQNKHVDAGAIDSAYFDTLINQGKLDKDQFKIIWESEPLYQYPWAVSSEVDDELIKLIQDTFVNIDDEEILRGFGATGFTTTSDENYDEIRKVMKEMGKLD